ETIVVEENRLAIGEDAANGHQRGSVVVALDPLGGAPQGEMTADGEIGAVCRWECENSRSGHFSAPHAYSGAAGVAASVLAARRRWASPGAISGRGGASAAPRSSFA